MSVEIERKFLVTEPPPGGVDGLPARDLRQGYLALDAEARVEVRLRGDGEAWTLTVKGGQGRARTEVEQPLDAARAAALWPLTEGRRVDKRRHELALGGGLVLELDVYAGTLEGLMTAEVEFPDDAAADAFVPPPWLGRELTGDDRYANRSLAVRGLP